jgi:hypothetical protein
MVTSENDKELGGQILLILAKSTRGVPDREMPLLKLELARKLPPLHDPPPVPS